MTVIDGGPFVGLQKNGYGAVVADPPWKFQAYSKLGLKRAPERHYETQALEWICGLPVADLAAKDCHLFLWIPGPWLAAGHHRVVLDAWGFEPSSMHTIWLKPKKAYRTQYSLFSLVDAASFIMGMGHTSRQNAEFVILGRKGSPQRHTKRMHQLLIEPRREHSRKPDAMRDRIEEYIGPDSKIVELFARSSLGRPRWDFWGNETNKFNEEPVAA